MKQKAPTQNVYKYLFASFFFACASYSSSYAYADVINIEAPNNGISLNQAASFQVGKEGVVFNNAQTDTTSTLAGAILMQRL